jgi:hypothetical protein
MPKTFVPGPKTQIDASIPCQFNIRSLLTGPILIVPARYEHAVISHSVSSGINTGLVRDIVTVLFQPTHCRRLDPEKTRVRPRGYTQAISRTKRTVVPDFNSFAKPVQP